MLSCMSGDVGSLPDFLREVPRDVSSLLLFEGEEEEVEEGRKDDGDGDGDEEEEEEEAGGAEGR